jgi:dTDP-4-dehydrorhamnose 3,5-epimerase
MRSFEVNNLSIFESDRGDLLKGFLKSHNDGFNVQEVYFSEVSPGEIKGWKKHTIMTCNMIVPVGKVEVVIVKSEENSYFHSEIISKDNYKLITIPPGIWFAFRGIGDGVNLLVNITDLEHDDSEVLNESLNKFNYRWK